MESLTRLPYWREVALLSFVLGVGFGLLTSVSWRRLVFLGALIMMVLSYFVRGLYCPPRGECASGGRWGVVAVAFWELGLLAAGSIRLGFRGLSRLRTRDGNHNAANGRSGTSRGTTLR